MESFAHGAQAVQEVFRVLKPGGKYVLMTYGDPSVRLEHLNKAAWTSIDHEVLKERDDDDAAADEPKQPKKEGRITHHLYICVKPQKEDQEQK